MKRMKSKRSRPPRAEIMDKLHIWFERFQLWLIDLRQLPGEFWAHWCILRSRQWPIYNRRLWLRMLAGQRGRIRRRLQRLTFRHVRRTNRDLERLVDLLQSCSEKLKAVNRDELKQELRHVVDNG